MPATHEDAVLMVELAKWGTMIGLGEASREIFADDFDPDAAETTNSSVDTMLVFNETIGTLVKNGLINRELIYDWLWVAGTWARVAPAAKRRREQTGEPRLYENYEALAAGQSLS